MYLIFFKNYTEFFPYHVFFSLSKAKKKEKKLTNFNNNWSRKLTYLARQFQINVQKKLIIN